MHLQALIAGSSGLVGREILRILAADPECSHVTALVRRPLEKTHDPKVGQAIVDFERLTAATASIVGTHLFSALGTTIKAAGSEAAFRKVDLRYPLRLAELARANGVDHLLLVSALGADSSSRIFYNRVKGELEEAVGKLGFRSLTIARPSLLLGDRAEHRRGEEIGKKFAFMTPKRWKPVHATQVAAALVRAAHEGKPGTEVLENPELLALPVGQPA